MPGLRARFHRTLVRFELEDELLGYYPVDRCETGHEYLTDESGEAINRAAARRNDPAAQEDPDPHR